MKRFTAIALTSLAVACSNGAGSGDRITVRTMGATAASCELSDDWGNRFVVAQTPGVVEIPVGSGDLRVQCQKVGYETAFSMVPEGSGGGLLYALGWNDDPSGYPEEVGVEMTPSLATDDRFESGGLGLPQGRAADSGGFGAIAQPPAPGTRFQASDMAPQGTPPVSTQQASGSDLMGGSSSSGGQRVWGQAVSDGAAPPPAPFAPTGDRRVQIGAAALSKTRPATGAVGPYSIQVGAFLDSRNADLMSRAMKSRGYEAETVTTEDRSGRSWTRVRFGNYRDRKSAAKAAKDFKRRESMNAVAVLK